MATVNPHFIAKPFDHVSRVLAHNPLGDRAERRTWVLCPRDVADHEPLPAIWMLAGFTSTGDSFLSFSPWQETLTDRVSRLYRTGILPPVRLVLPDVFTAFGGCQYLDSPAIGPYATYLWDELLPAVEQRYATHRRALAGKSSGGFGAWVSALAHPELFSALACHSGDMAFEWCYLPDMPKLLAVIKSAGGLTEFWTLFHRTPKKSGNWIAAINLLAMAAAYSPNPDRELGLELPVDPDTLELLPEIWERWRRWDPLRLVQHPEHQETLKQMALIFFDAGERDDFNLQYGGRQMHRRLTQLAIRHRYEEFPDNHFQTHYRYDVSLPLLATAVTNLS